MATGNFEELKKFVAYPAALGHGIVQVWQEPGSSDMDSPAGMSVTSVGTLAWLQPAEEEDDQADHHCPVQNVSSRSG